ncbi:hypothetical protein MTR67_042776 [Solanum verrucosum]|uniref:Transposase n=1 Tax=Solanum verrucosum TaxID=315347 RepID=A0AAF0UQP3_SOLVR|nr:hypothetical protein MTR67_042776 [Solanum verrucosum]
MSSCGDGDRHREHLGVSQTKQSKKKKSRRPIDIAGSISSAPERISHDTHLFVVPFGTTDPRQYYPNYHRPVSASSTLQALPSRRYEDLPLQAICRARPLSVGTPSPIGTSPQLSAMRLGDSSSEQSDAMVGTPLLTQRFVHPDVSPSSTATPSAIPHDMMFALAPSQKDRLGRVMIEPDRSSLYTQAYHSWSKIPNSIRQAMFNNFKESRYNLVIGTTFERKASARLCSWLKKVWDSGERPSWMLPHVFDELGQYWNTDKFKAISDQAKMARGSLKGDSLHTGGAKMVETIAREMEKELGRTPIEPEVFKKTHVRKKENESDPDVWVEERAERTFNDFHQYVAENLDSSVQLTPELSTQIWKEKVVGGTHKGRYYGLGSRNDVRRLQSGLEGIGSSSQAEALDGVQIAAMSDQIAKLTAALAESKRRRVAEQKKHEIISCDDEIIHIYKNDYKGISRVGKFNIRTVWDCSTVVKSVDTSVNLDNKEDAVSDDFCISKPRRSTRIVIPPKGWTVTFGLEESHVSRANYLQEMSGDSLPYCFNELPADVIS